MALGDVISIFVILLYSKFRPCRLRVFGGIVKEALNLAAGEAFANLDWTCRIAMRGK